MRSRLVISGDRISIVKKKFSPAFAKRENAKVTEKENEISIEASSGLIDQVIAQNKKWFLREELTYKKAKPLSKAKDTDK